MVRDPSLEASTHIPEAEKIKLWVRAGGRCAFCNRYLLQDEITVQPLNLAELAHNVGRKATEKSPRGLNPLPITKRNKAENLLLLCKDHHTLIDDGLKRGEYSVERLNEIKRTHEDRVEYLTGLDVDRETTVVRIIADIRGSAPDVSRETVRQTVLDQARYPRFPLAFGGQDLEIDLRNLPGEGTPEYWNAGQQRIDEALNHRLNEGIRRHQVRHLSIFPFARIPLLVYFGYQLDDKVPTTLYQKHRGADESWHWDDTAPAREFDHSTTRIGEDHSRVTVVLSLSGTVDLEELPGVLADTTVITLAPRDETPNPNLLRSIASLSNFRTAFQELLGELEATYKGADIHLVAAVPVTAAVVCGRSIMRDAHPAVVVYDRQGSSYGAALEVNRR